MNDNTKKKYNLKSCTQSTTGFIVFITSFIIFVIKALYAQQEVTVRFRIALVSLIALNAVSYCANHFDCEEGYFARLSKFFLSLILASEVLLSLINNNEITETFLRAIIINLLLFYVPFVVSYLNRLTFANLRKGGPALEVAVFSSGIILIVIDYKLKFNNLTTITALSTLSLTGNSIEQIIRFFERRERLWD